jgi:hypothetical protein
MTIPLNLKSLINVIINNSKMGIKSDDLLEDFYDYFKDDGYDYLSDIDNTEFSIFMYDQIRVEFNDKNARSEFKIPANVIITDDERLRLVHKIMHDELREPFYSHPLLHTYKLSNATEEVYLCCVNYSGSHIEWYGTFLKKSDFLNVVKEENIWAIQAGYIPNKSEIKKIWSY